MTPENLLTVTGRDMSMYYNNTALPIEQPDAASGVATFVISDIRSERMSGGNYQSFIARGCRLYMKANGQMTISDAEDVRFTSFISDGLSKPHTQLGYIYLPSEGEYVWVTTRARITTRKGLSRDRLVAYRRGMARDIESFNIHSFWAALYTTNENIIGRDFLRHPDGDIRYKEKRVGVHRTDDGDTTLRLFPAFAYLQNKLQTESGQQVEVLQNGNSRRA